MSFELQLERRPAAVTTASQDVGSEGARTVTWSTHPHLVIASHKRPDPASLATPLLPPSRGPSRPGTPHELTLPSEISPPHRGEPRRWPLPAPPAADQTKVRGEIGVGSARGSLSRLGQGRAQSLGLGSGLARHRARRCAPTAGPLSAVTARVPDVRVGTLVSHQPAQRRAPGQDGGHCRRLGRPTTATVGPTALRRRSASPRRRAAPSPPGSGCERYDAGDCRDGGRP